MEIGINIEEKSPYREVIKAFVENGVKRTFVTCEHPELDEVMNLLDANGITVDNMHAPIDRINDIWYEGEAGDEMLRRLFNSVLNCKKYNVKVMITHASVRRPMPPITETGAKRFFELVRFAGENNVTVAFENHKFLENVEFVMKLFPDAGFCWDTGHENSFTQGIEYMPFWGDRLVALHINDNEGILDRDSHMLPFDGNVNFEKVAKYLCDYKYNGTLMLEVKQGNHKLYKEMDINEYYALAAQKARKLADMVEKLRSNA